MAELLSSRGDVCQHLGNGTGGICSPSTRLSDKDLLSAAQSRKSLLQQDRDGWCGSMWKSGSGCTEPNSASKGLTFCASQLRLPGSLCLDISDVEIKEPEFVHRAGNTPWKGCRHKAPPSPALPAQPLPCCVDKEHTHTQRIKLWISPIPFPEGENFQTALLGDTLQTFSQQELNPAGICSEV